MPVKIVKNPTIYKSVSLNGSTDYLTVPDNAALRFSAADFTIEGWVYPTANGQGNGSVIICQSANGVSSQYSVYYASNNVLTFYTEDTFYNSRTVSSGNVPLTLNTWNYITVARKAGSVYLGVNGALQSDPNVNATYRTVAHAISIGSQLGYSGTFLTGYISNLRVLNGTCLYSSSFTPPTAPLLPITNTSLLTCASTTFKDVSSNNFTVSSFGSPTVSDVVPYSVPRNGFKLSSSNFRGEFKKSVQFNGSNQYLTVGNTSNFNFLHNGLSNWTVEGWVYFNSLSGTDSRNWISDGANTSTQLGMSIVFGAGISNGLRIYISRGASGGPASIVGYSTTANVFTNTNTWYHVAVTFNSSSKLLSAYINGTATALNLISTYQNSVGFAYSNSNSAYVMAIGRGQFTTPFGYFDGYMSNTRVLNGTVLYTASFSVPTTPLTAITNTLLLICQDSVTKDNSSNNFTVNAIASPTLSALNPFTVDQTYSKMGWGLNMKATGGDLITTSGSYNIHTFTTVGTSSFTVSYLGNNPSIEYLVVGGGGGGGYVAGVYDSRGGGGGAGGFRTGSISSGFAIGNYPIVVGSGGSLNNNGENSSLFTVTSLGGGGGGFSSTAAKTGGSGGGGGAMGSGGNFAGASGTAGQGNSGGGGGTDSSTYRYGGGGGGAGSVGVTAINSSTACVGGSGSYSNITGTNTPYAGGGGGGQHAGGIGGGGAGQTTGSANTGGGGGGGFTTSQYANYPGGAGGSGIIIIKYRYTS